MVAPADAVLGIARMFEAMTERYFRATMAFRTFSEAEMWLGIPAPKEPAPPGQALEEQ